MGSSQSKAPSDTEINEKLLERLRALQTKYDHPEGRDYSEKDYVVVNDHKAPSKPRTWQHDIKVQNVEDWEKQLLQDPKNRLALNAFTKNAATDVIRNGSTVICDPQTFNVKIPFEGSPVTNQRSSGRCWLFASTNVFRVAIMQKYKLSEFELSQSYLFYWDKIEKANYFLENIIETADEPLNGRLIQELLKSPVGDGGQWDMVANLVSKYGLVPQTLYPDSFNAMSSSAMDRLITTKLREDALRIRSQASSASSASISALKDKFMQEIHLILTLMLGPPPSPNKEFTWEFYDKNNAFHSVTAKPTSFAKDLSDKSTIRACGGTDVNKLFSLVNDPRNEYLSLLTVNRLGNVKEGRPITYVNVDIKTIKDACIATLKKGNPIFFGSDVGKYSDSRLGIMDTSLYDYELGFNVKLGMSKAERLMTGESAMTHAMTLTGVHLDKDGKSVRWRVENSWGDSAGTKGYFVMSDEWMDEFVYQAVVDPSVVSDDVRKVLEQEPTVLDLWDPMGALA